MPAAAAKQTTKLDELATVLPAGTVMVTDWPLMTGVTVTAAPLVQSPSAAPAWVCTVVLVNVDGTVVPAGKVIVIVSAASRPLTAVAAISYCALAEALLLVAVTVPPVTALLLVVVV